MVPGYIGCYVYYESDYEDEIHIVIQYTEVFNRMMTVPDQYNTNLLFNDISAYFLFS